jgi:hypothetical protein
LWLQVAAGKHGHLRRWWLFRYATGEIATSKNGKARKVERVTGLGPLDGVSLTTARRMAADRSGSLATGQDPIQVRDDPWAAQAALAACAMAFEQPRRLRCEPRERMNGKTQAGVDQPHP